MALGGSTGTGWYAVAPAAEVGTTPLPVAAGDRAYVVVRLQPGGEVSAFPARCPHRLVPLRTATVTDGRLQCPAHGWRFDSEGRCVDIPSLGATGTPPPRADLAMPWALEERHGWVWLAPDRTAVLSPPRPPTTPVPEPAPAPTAPRGPVFGNLDPSLEHAWHPVALSRELRPGGWLQVRLLGRNWMLRREGDEVSAEPPAFAVRERLGVIWLAPAEPADVPLDVPEAGDRRFISNWLSPLRSPGPAGPMVDTFLDATHGPFVHASTIGPADGADMAACQVEYEPGGFTSVQEQWCDNPVDPEVAVGSRPLRQRRRTTYTYRAPFQLRLRQEFLDSGATTTIVYLLQPEDVDSSRLYVRLLLSDGPGRRLPTPATAAGQMALQQQILEEDIRSQAVLELAGLPLDRRDELHVPADGRGVALRQALCDFTAASQREIAA
jgi:phenylpropionate dioxygenase-like ring-hydroxylating dioxygenase large terminal subunit